MLKNIGKYMFAIDVAAKKCSIDYSLREDSDVRRQRSVIYPE